MMNKTHSKGLGRTLRRGTAGVISATVLMGSALAVVATPAFATAPMAIGISGVGLMVGGFSGAGANDIAGPDFSYATSGAPMARNVGVTVEGMAPNTTVSLSWRDATAGGAWQPGPSTTVSTAWSPGFYEASAIIDGIPSSACGHTVQIEATGQTGIWVPPALPNYSTLYTVTSAPEQVTENCGPAIWPTGNGPSITGFAGDGFTPGGTVAISGTGPVLSRLFCVTFKGHRTCVLKPWTETVTATTTLFGLHCVGVGGQLRCLRYVARAGSDISVTFPAPIQECTGSPNPFTAVDRSTGLSASGSVGGVCIE